MPKYLFQGTYTKEGLEGLLKEGGSSRREAVVKATQGLGGKVEAFYYAFGKTDFYVIIDLPDNAAATAASLITNAAGTTHTSTTVLVTPEETDQAVALANEKAANYRPPGR